MAEESRFTKTSEGTKEDANKWLVVVGLIVAGLLIGGGLVFAGYKLTQQRVPELEEFSVPPVTTPSPATEPVTPTAPPEATPTAGEAEPETEAPLSGESAFGGWETYTNTDYGYQFQHPAGWNFSVDVVNEDPGTALYVIRQGIQSNDVDDYRVLVRAWDNPDELTLPEWIQFMRDSNALGLPVEEMETTANTQVGGNDALQFWSDPLSGGTEPGECFQACPVLSVYFVHGDNGYVAQLNYLREFDEDSFVLFSQILSTFEFL